MPRRPTFAERIAQTVAFLPVRERAKKRLSRALREALAPAPPAAALSAYSATMATYAKRTEALVEQLVLSQLPVLGSGDELDTAALERGLVDLEARLNEVAERGRRSARAAAKRAAQQARVEAQRILGMTIPKDDHRVMVVVHDFENLGVQRMRAVGSAQVQRIRKAIAEYKEGDSLRAGIKESLWISRVRGQLNARRVVYGVQTELLASYSLAVGVPEFIWCTRRDERVRHGHSVLDGKTFRWDSPPDTGNGEGRNLPGKAPNCRCRALPVAQ